MPMTNEYSYKSLSSDTAKHNMTSPRRQSINFIRQFARSCAHICNGIPGTAVLN